MFARVYICRYTKYLDLNNICYYTIWNTIFKDVYNQDDTQNNHAFQYLADFDISLISSFDIQ